MAKLTEIERWEEEIYRIEENDPVHGGENGITNKPTKQLANRTRFLRQQLLLAGQKLVPKKLTSTTRNLADETGHTHEIERGDTTKAGLMQLTNDTGLESENLGLSAKGGKAIAQSVAQLQQRLNDGLNQKVNKTDISDAANSESRTSVASSKAVKTAYDKATAAEQLAQTKQDALVRHRLDLTALDADRYHLLTFFPTGAQMDGRRWPFQILRPLRGLGRVTWATHNGGGVSLQIGWSSNASGWGSNGLYRVIEHVEYAFTPQSPIIGIGQNVNASIEYCYLRGGSVYFADALAGFEVVVQTEGVTRNGITLAPSREFDARLVPLVDVKQAREVVTEAVRHKNLESLIPGSDVRWDRAAPRELPNGTYVGLGRRAFLNVDEGTYTGWQMLSRAQEAWQSVRFGANNNRLFFQQAKSETEWREPIELFAARPQTAWNLNDILIVGVYPQADQSLATTARNYPIAQPGQLWVTPWGDTLQQRYVAIGGETFQRQRIGNTGTQWSRWTRIDGADWADIRNRPWNVEANLATRNLNEITNFGLYGQVVDSNATAERNYPERSGGALLVMPSAYGVLQEYTTWLHNKKYVRGRDGNGWLPWRRVDSQDCVAKSGDTMTGTLVLPEIHVTKNNGGGRNIRIGDDAWIGDDAVGYGVKIKAQGDESKGAVAFGNSSFRLGRGIYYDHNFHSILEWEGDYLSLNAKNGNFAGVDVVRQGNHGNFRMRMEALPDKRWKFWAEHSHEVFIPAKNGTVALEEETVRKSGDTMTGALKSRHIGHGAYVSQYRSEAPFLVEAIGDGRRDTFHPFIKGKMHSYGNYGGSFSFGWTSHQGGGDGFGRGAIVWTGDNGETIPEQNKLWSFETNGDFISSGDVKTGGGRSLNEAVRRIGGDHDIQLAWKADGLNLKVDATELGRFAMLSDFLGSQDENGWQKLPNGLILQWGLIVKSGEGSRGNQSFHLEFPNKCFAVLFNPWHNGVRTVNNMMLTARPTRRGFSTYTHEGSNGVMWLAIGN